MPNYAIFIDGQNFLLDLEGKEERFGFFITKRLIADSEEVAISQAFASLRSDPKLAPAYEKADLVQPTLSVEVVHELNQDNEMNDTGYTFYRMDEQ